MSKQTKAQKTLARRNPLYNHPLLKKGSSHYKTNKSKRRLEKIKIKKEWLPQSIFSKIYFGEVIFMFFHKKTIKHYYILRLLKQYLLLQIKKGYDSLSLKLITTS